jgi:hypothetical protein
VTRGIFAGRRLDELGKVDDPSGVPSTVAPAGTLVAMTVLGLMKASSPTVMSPTMQAPVRSRRGSRSKAHGTHAG